MSEAGLYVHFMRFGVAVALLTCVAISAVGSA